VNTPYADVNGRSQTHYAGCNPERDCVLNVIHTLGCQPELILSCLDPNPNPSPNPKAAFWQAHLADLLEKMLALDPDKRIRPKDALKHPFVKWGRAVEGGGGIRR